MRLGGRRRSGEGPGRRRRFGRAALLPVAAALLVLVVAPVAGAVAARSYEGSLAGQLRQGELAFQQGRQQLTDGYKKQDPGLVRQAAASFAASLARFQRLPARSMTWARRPGARRPPSSARGSPRWARWCGWGCTSTRRP